MLLITIGGWYAQDVRRTQEKMSERQEKIADRLNVMDVQTATVQASRFSSSDWITAKGIIDAQFNASERRIFKLETANEQVAKSLDRIESKLGTAK